MQGGEKRGDRRAPDEGRFRRRGGNHPQRHPEQKDTAPCTEKNTSLTVFARFVLLGRKTGKGLQKMEAGRELLWMIEIS